MRAPRKPERKRHTPQRRSPVNRFVRAILGLFAAPRINMREDYEKVRRLQRQFTAPTPASRATDYQIPAEHGAHHIPVRVFHPREQRRKTVLGWKSRTGIWCAPCSAGIW